MQDLTSRGPEALAAAMQELGIAQLPPAWRSILQSPALAGNASALAHFLVSRRAAGAHILPPDPWAVLRRLAPEQVRVLILGQDPYHGPGQAHGFAFSVPAGVRPPPSLRNILTEVSRDTGASWPAGQGDLGAWVDQGVLLLNTVLTVEEGQPASHAGQGWEALTGALLGALGACPSLQVVMLWGAAAQRCLPALGPVRAGRRVLQANHPSPLAARRPPVPFMGCGHFSACNQHLVAAGEVPIDWTRVPDGLPAGQG